MKEVIRSSQEELDLLLHGKGGVTCTRCKKSIYEKDAIKKDGLTYCSCCAEIILGGE